MEAGVAGMTWRGITRHWPWKLASLILAVALWFVVVGEPELVTIQAAPVLYRNLPAGLILLSDAPDNVRVELRGPSGRLTRTTLSEIFASLDLAGVAGPGEQTFTLSGEDFSLPRGVAFLRAVPSQLRLNFDRMVTKDVAVEIRLNGTPPAGYRVTRQEAIPGFLRISGPQTRVAAIDRAQTDELNVSAMTQTTAVRINAFVSDNRVQFESSPVVTVKLTIEKTGSTQ